MVSNRWRKNGSLLGFIAFTLFYRRLSLGKKKFRRYHSDAIHLFLTAQQFERASSLISLVIRDIQKDCGEISIGLWVGQR